MNFEKLVKKASKANKAGDFGLAKTLCNKIISQVPDNPVGYKLLATNLIKLNEYISAEKIIGKAIALGEQSLMFYQLQANVWIETEKFDLALHQLEQLFNQTGENSILLDIALVYHRLGQFKDAMNVYMALIERQPEHQQARYNLSLLQLYTCDLIQGWEGFEARHNVADALKMEEYTLPYRSGDSLAGKRVLVVPEQGIADQIIFSSCLPDLLAIAEEVLVICDERLKQLFINSFDGIQVYTKKDLNSVKLRIESCNLQIPMGTLPSVFRSSASKFTSTAVYKTDPILVEKVKAQLNPQKLNVGISWYGGQKNNAKVNRWSSNIADWQALFQLENINWVDLQFGEHKQEVARESSIKGNLISIVGFSAKDNFTHYGALIEQLDLVISVDNAAAVFSAFLGKTTWVLAPKDPFWIWSQIEGGSPWFSNNDLLLTRGKKSWSDCLLSLKEPLVNMRDQKLKSTL